MIGPFAWLRSDQTAAGQDLAVTARVIGAVGQEDHRPADPASDPTPDRWGQLEQREQLGDVVSVGWGYLPRERDPVLVDGEVVLDTGPAPVDGTRSGPGAPHFAWMWLESTDTRPKSRTPAPRSWPRSSSCSVSHTPAACHSRSRRQHVIPEP